MANRQTCLNLTPKNCPVRLGLTSQHPGGGYAHIGAILVQAYTPHQRRKFGFRQARIGASRARLGAIERFDDARNYEIGIHVNLGGMYFQYFFRITHAFPSRQRHRFTLSSILPSSAIG